MTSRDETQEHFFACPYCWEKISMVLDLSGEDQNFIEDCEVCCRPIQIRCTTADGAVVSFEFLKTQ